MLRISDWGPQYHGETLRVDWCCHRFKWCHSHETTYKINSTCISLVSRTKKTAWGFIILNEGHAT
jgi:hypothetical protein